MNNIKHTPTPWHVVYHDDVPMPYLEDDKKNPVNMYGHADIGRANTAFIEKAVNCHDELFEAVRRLLYWVETMPPSLELAGDRKFAQAAFKKAIG